MSAREEQRKPEEERAAGRVTAFPFPGSASALRSLSSGPEIKLQMSRCCWISVAGSLLLDRCLWISLLDQTQGNLSWSGWSTLRGSHNTSKDVQWIWRYPFPLLTSRACRLDIVLLCSRVQWSFEVVVCQFCLQCYSCFGMVVLVDCKCEVILVQFLVLKYFSQYQAMEACCKNVTSRLTHTNLCIHIFFSLFYH